MIIHNDIQLDFDDVLIRPNKSLINSRSEVRLERKYKFRWTHDEVDGFFLMNSNMLTTGSKKIVYKMLENNMFACLHKHYDYKELDDIFQNMPDAYKNRCFVSIGLKDEETEKFDYVYKKYNIKNVVIDAPNAYITKFLEKIKEIRSNYPDSRIIAGNVCTSEGCMEIILSGADCVKINIGNGAACLTRKKTGIGRPTLSTIIECANTCHQLGALCLSDGGIRYPSDVVKALGANADGIMIGSLFAGCEEASGKHIIKYFKTNEIDEFDKNQDKCVVIQKHYKEHFGMSSEKANNLFAGGMKNYKTSEGRELLIPYTGPLQNIIDDINGGICSAMTYLGCNKLKDISKHTTFYLVHQSSQLNKSMEQYDYISNK